MDDVDLQLRRGEVIALVGESGCGKSTLSLTLMELEDVTVGSIIFEGKDITRIDDSERKKIRQRIQMVFQDLSESLNPTQSIEEIVTVSRSSSSCMTLAQSVILQTVWR